MRVVVMGVSGSGKSTVGAALATRLGVDFMDGDALHPEANVAKMHSGQPLTDEDRWPWLERIGEWLAARSDGVIVCSALRRAYRDRIRYRAPDAVMLHLAGAEATIAGRLAHRGGHFMPPSLLGSQFATLEPLQPDERGVVVDVRAPVDEVIDRAYDDLRQLDQPR
jgi:carbohydrate kinase (thermoresistant glucokinase family)